MLLLLLAKLTPNEGEHVPDSLRRVETEVAGFYLFVASIVEVERIGLLLFAKRYEAHCQNGKCQCGQ